MRTAIFIAILLSTLPLSLMAPSSVAAEKSSVSNSTKTTTKDEDLTQIPLDEIRRYVAVYNAIKVAYVEPVEDKKLMQSAIKGLLLDLDPHSTYFEKQEAEQFDEMTEGTYEGIGVELIQLEDKTLKIISPIEGSPAEKAGILAGDIITAIDNKPMSEQEGMDLLRGPLGTQVSLTVKRKDSDKPIMVDVVRDTIRTSSITSRLLEPNYAQIRINSFQTDTAEDFKKNLEQLIKDNKAPLRGLILDLRGNPGGLLSAAVEIADDLLDGGAIVSTRGRIAASDSYFEASPGDVMNGAPIIVLVDAGSASASEVLAGALRDNQRAQVVGSRTFGKGSVQTVLPLDNGDSVKLTTARYYTPSGKSIQARGIDPDVVLHPDKKSEAKTAEDEELIATQAESESSSYSEAALPGHLHGDLEEKEKLSPNEFLPGEAPIKSALVLLKGLSKDAAAKKQTAAAKNSVNTH